MEGSMPEGETGAALLETARTFGLVSWRSATGLRPLDGYRKRSHGDLARAGFFRIFLPVAYGGLDLTPMEAMEVFEELAQADASVEWCVWNGNTHWTGRPTSSELQSHTRGPRRGDSEPAPSSGSAHRDHGYRVSGRCHW